MILVDYRTGSGELAQPLRDVGCPVDVCTLDYGDFAFQGNGPNGKSAVGIERKTVNDMLTSVQNLRWAGHQLIGMCEYYDWAWLIIEGMYRPEPVSGRLQVAGALPDGQYLKGKWFNCGFSEKQWYYRDLDGLITTLETQAAMRVRRTNSPEETVKVIQSLYNWWVSNEWNEHKSHLALDTVIQRDARLMTRPTTQRLMVAQLPSIGYEKSEAVVKHFGNTPRKVLEGMLKADSKEWQKIKGIGKTLAGRLVELLK